MICLDGHKSANPTNRDDHVNLTLFMGSQIEVSIREDLGRRARAEFMSNDEADEALTIAPRVCA